MVKSVTSNTCNSTCVTCGSGPSSAWAPLERKLNIIPRTSTSITKEKIDNELNLKNLITINFVGGEPLYEKLNFYILEKLIEYNNTNCFITFTTNGSVDLDQNKKDLLKKFKNVSFNISIDGLGPVFEYMRFPLKWDKLLENLEFFRTITDNNSVSHTTSNLNVLYHHETVEWFKKENLNYHFNPVINPSHFRPSALPRTVKEYIFKKFGHTKDLEFFIGSPHTDQDDKDFYTMLDRISLQDQVKNISIKNYLPELADLIDFL
jgi:sulfatase maturation enzyme AslB (radical SAM superfamily)